MAGDLDEAQVREHPAQRAQLLDELDVRLGLPGLGQQADRVRGVGVDDHRARAILDLLEAAQDRGQLGDVVRALAEELGQLALALAVDDHDAEAGGSRVAGARAVGPDVDRVRGTAAVPSRRGAVGGLLRLPAFSAARSPAVELDRLAAGVREVARPAR